MDTEFALPFFAKTTWVVGIFLVSLLVFDLLLVRWLKLNKIAWKRVDYIWLGIGALGLIGAVEIPRNVVATNLLGLAESRMIGAISRLNAAVRFGQGPAICRTFVRSEFSPPPAEFDKAQREYDTVCAWFKAVAPLLPQKPDMRDPIDTKNLPSPPAASDQSLRWAFDEFNQGVVGVNQQLAIIHELRAAKKRGLLEELLQLLGPVLLAIALALRITKVTGEIKNEA